MTPPKLDENAVPVVSEDDLRKLLKACQGPSLEPEPGGAYRIVAIVAAEDGQSPMEVTMEFTSVDRLLICLHDQGSERADRDARSQLQPGSNLAVSAISPRSRSDGPL